MFSGRDMGDIYTRTDGSESERGGATRRRRIIEKRKERQQKERIKNTLCEVIEGSVGHRVEVEEVLVV